MKVEEVTEWYQTLDFKEANKKIKIEGFRTFKILSSRTRVNEVEQAGPCYVLGKTE